jgi:serine/threonine protein kinase/WD40 repeat protein
MTTRVQLAFNEDLARRLPLPLAQLYRRAHNAKSALERHQAAYYLWEAALKLLASVAIAEYAALDERDPDLMRRLESLTRPSVGHWWELIRRIVPVLADSGGGDPGFRAVRDLVLGATRADLPRAAGLDAALAAALGAGGGARSTVRLSELFDRLVQYRNRELGHGAAGQREASFYERMGPALLAGVAEILDAVDPLAGRELIHVADVRRQADGSWLIERYALEGETARRLETVEVPGPAASSLPRPGCVYAARGHAAGSAPGGLRSLHPLLLHDADTGVFSFLNACRGPNDFEHLSYSTGRVERRDNLLVGDADPLVSVLGLATMADGRSPERGRAEEPTAESSGLSPAGRRIGEFELLSRMGRGGMGVVYRAWQPSLGRQVALKVLFSAGDPKVESRFAREIRALGRVEHPNLVKIFTSGSDGERWFYAMEVVEGADLARVCDQLVGSTASDVGASDWQRAVSSAYLEARKGEEPIRDGSDTTARGGPRDGTAATTPPPEAPGGSAPAKTAVAYVHQVVEAMRQVAGAAHALHEEGIVHRDIKPGNIVLTAEGSHAVLMDLGLAQLADDAQGRLTRTRQFVGTLRYASPEQVLAAGSLDRRSDVYSLGATLWELLTLRPLFGAGDETPSHELMLKIQSEDPARARKLNPRVDADLDAIVTKCLEKSPARRYASAAGLADDLGRWQRGEPVLAQPQTLGYLLGKFARRYRGRLAAAAALFLVLIGLGVYSTLRIHGAHRRSELALFDLYTSFGLQATEDHDMSGALLWFAEAAAVPHGDPERERAGRARLGSWYPEVAMPLRAFAFDGEVVQLVFHPEGTHLLGLGASQRSTIWDLQAGVASPVPGGEHEITLAAWSPRGDLLVLGGPGGAGVFEFPGGGKVHRFEGPPAVNAIAFRPDGRVLALGDDGVRLWDSERRAFVGEPIAHPKPVRWLGFSRDGNRLLTSAADNLARIFEIGADGSAVETMEPVPHFVVFNIPGLLRFGVPWKPVLVDEGRGLITVTSPTEVTWWDVGTRARKSVIPVAERLADLVPSPDGQRLAIVDFQGCQVWNLASGREEGQKFLTGGGRPLAEWRPDGSALLLTGDDLQVLQWTLPPRRHVRSMSLLEPRVTAAIPHSARVREMRYSPSGGHIVTAQAGGLVRLWRPGDETRTRRRLLPLEFAVWSPDRTHFVPRPYDLLRSIPRTRVHSLLEEEPDGACIDPGGVLEEAIFSPDSMRLLTVSAVGSRHEPERRVIPPGAPISIDLWDWRSGERVWRVPAPSLPVEIAFSADRGHVAIRCQEGQFLTIDSNSGAVRSRVEVQASGVSSLFVPGGERFISWGKGKALQIWSTETGAEQVPGLERPVEPLLVRFSIDGARLATVSAGPALHVWDVASGRLVSARMVHPGPVTEIDLAGDRLATVGVDRFVRVWDWRRGELAGTPFEQRFEQKDWDSELMVAMLPATYVYVAAASESSVSVLEIRTGKPVLPPLRPGLLPRSLVASEDHLLLGSHTLEIHEIGVRDFEAAGARIPPALWREVSEVVSGRAVRDGGISRLPVAAWLERWEALRRVRPEEIALDLSREARQAWHARRAAALEALLQWDATAWHIEQLGPAATREDRRRRARVRSFVQAWRFAREARTWRGAEDRRFDALDRDTLDAIAGAAASTPLVRSRGPFVDFLERYPESASLSLGYAVRTIVSTERRRVRFLSGSDDTLRVWLNGAEVHSLMELGPPIVDYVTIPVELAPGENLLLVEVGQSGGAWGLYFRIEDEDGRRLHLHDDGRLEPLDENIR